MSNTTLTAALASTKKVLAKQNVSLLDVVRAIQVDAARELPTAQKSPLPKPVKTTDEQRKALGELLDIVDTMTLPTVHRALRPAEVAKILSWTETAKAAEKVVDSMITQLKAAFFNHADALAEQDGRAIPGETPRDRNGWYLLDDREKAGVVKDAAHKLTREARVGSVALTVDAVDTLIEEGVLPATARKRFVKTVEAVDESAVIAYMAENPQDIPTIASKVTQVSAPSVSFHIRNNS